MIKDKVPDQGTAITMILSRWLKRQFNVQKYGEPTWKSLIAAVAHRNGGNNAVLAMKLADKHKGNSNSMACKQHIILIIGAAKEK